MAFQTESATGTDWRSLAVDQMWEMVKDHSDDAGWTEAAAWQRTFELIDYHRSRLQHYRDLLAAKWPPERSPAAAAFLAQVDTLMASMAEMRDAAISNGPALSGITSGLTDAKTNLGPVYQQWAANQAELDGYTQQTAPTTNGVPAPALAPSPIAPTEQDRLHTQAVSIMSALSAQTMESKAAIVVPPAYKAPVPRSERLEPVTGIPPTSPSADETGAATGPERRTQTNTDSSASIARPELAAQGAPPAPINRQNTARGLAPIGAAEPAGLGAATTTVPIPQGAVGASPASDRTVAKGSAPAESREVVGQRPAATSTVEDGPSRNARTTPLGGATGPKSTQETLGVAGGPLCPAPGINQNGGRRPRTYDADKDWPVPPGIPAVLEPGEDCPIDHDPGPIFGPTG